LIQNNISPQPEGGSHPKTGIDNFFELYFINDGDDTFLQHGSSTYPTVNILKSFKNSISEALNDITDMIDTIKKLNIKITKLQELNSHLSGKRINKEKKQGELSKKEKELERLEALKDKLSGEEVSLPMETLNTDSDGLTTSGALLDFAHTGDTPQLLDSAMGKLALYFQGSNSQFFTAYYDTKTARAQKVIDADGGKIRFLARSVGAESNAATITISDGNSDDTCTVTIAKLETEIPETWENVPRDPRMFSKVLNGQAKPLYLAQVAGTLGTVTELTLVETTNRQLAAGAVLKIGDTQVTTSAEVEANSSSIPVNSVFLDVEENTPVYLVVYDYPSDLSLLQFLVYSEATAGTIRNGTATSLGDAPSCRWVADPPGLALNFQGNQYLALAQDKLPQMNATANLTLEAWVKPTHVSNVSRVVYHKSKDSKYTLGLQKKDSNTYKVFARVGERFLKAKDVIPSGNWKHLALSYHQSYALNFDGNDYLDCGKNRMLNICEDLTIETVVQVSDTNLGSIISKGLMGYGVEEKESVPYALEVKAGKLIFSFEDSQGVVYKLESPDKNTKTDQLWIPNNTVHRIAVTRQKVTQTTESGADPTEWGTADVADIDAKTGEFSSDENQKIDKAMKADYVASKKRGKRLKEGLSKQNDTTTSTATTSEESTVMTGQGITQWLELKMYIDGVLVCSRVIEPAVSPKGNNQPLEIGRIGESYFKGKIAEVKLWSRALEQSEIHQKLTGQEKGLVAWWQLEENEGNLANDFKGGNHAQIKGATWCKNPDGEGVHLIFVKTSLIKHPI